MSDSVKWKGLTLKEWIMLGTLLVTVAGDLFWMHTTMHALVPKVELLRESQIRVEEYIKYAEGRGAGPVALPSDTGSKP